VGLCAPGRVAGVGLESVVGVTMASNHSPTIPSPSPHPMPGPIETLLTVYRRMMGGGHLPSLVIDPEFKLGHGSRSEDRWIVRLSVRIEDVEVFSAEGETTEDAARAALEQLRENGALV